MVNGDGTGGHGVGDDPVVTVTTRDIFQQLQEMNTTLLKMQSSMELGEQRRDYERDRIEKRVSDAEADVITVFDRLAKVEAKLYSIPALSSVIGLAAFALSAYSILGK